jgi:hypothetical protein
VPCQGDITALRQIHIGTGRHRSSVETWLLSPARINQDTQKLLVSIYPEFVVLSDPAKLAGGVLDTVSEIGSGDVDLWHGGQAFLLDPAANIILRYIPGYDPVDINKDLDRLLKWSDKD